MAEPKERRVYFTLILEDGYQEDHLHIGLRAAIESLKGVKRVEPGDYEQARATVIEAVRGALNALDRQQNYDPLSRVG